jgi:hypothetical protein
MLAPLAASLLRYGACALPITLERCLFSKITTTMWSGGGAAALGFFGAGRRPVVFCSFGVNGRSTAVNFFGARRATAVVSFGFGCTTMGRLSDRRDGPADGGSATAQPADVNSNIPATAQPVDRGKARTWKPLRSKYSQNTI